jgi:uncharacterized protein
LSIGLIALFDNMAAIAKLAATSLDDAAALATKAGVKATGVVLDDAAITPQYVIGFDAKRELPIVGKIAAGSLRNKLVLLLPGILALSYFFPWMITPLLMFGGGYLCYEGSEKILGSIFPRQAQAQPGAMTLSQHALEAGKVAGAIRTDFILSAEIMAITLGAVADESILMQALVLALVGVGITVAVYGVVALIVKADDFGVALTKTNGGSIAGRIGRTFGRALVLGMPGFLMFLGVAGTAAMVWVGGDIILHSLEAYGVHSVSQAIRSAAGAAARALPSTAELAKWTVMALLSGIVGLLIGAVSIPVIGFVLAPAWNFLTDYLCKP